MINEKSLVTKTWDELLMYATKATVRAGLDINPADVLTEVSGYWLSCAGDMGEIEYVQLIQHEIDTAIRNNDSYGFAHEVQPINKPGSNWLKGNPNQRSFEPAPDFQYDDNEGIDAVSFEGACLIEDLVSGPIMVDRPSKVAALARLSGDYRHLDVLSIFTEELTDRIEIMKHNGCRTSVKYSNQG